MRKLAIVLPSVTLVVQQAFDGVLALLLAIDVIEEQFGLTLTGPDYRFFKLTYGVSDRGLDLLAYQNISCFEFRISGSGADLAMELILPFG